MGKYNKNVPLKFGKYEGIELSVIEERDPQYVVWLVKNVKMFKNYYTAEEIKQLEIESKKEKNSVFFQ